MSVGLAEKRTGILCEGAQSGYGGNKRCFSCTARPLRVAQRTIRQSALQTATATYPRRRPFIDVFMHMKQAYQSIVVALQKGQEGKVISKPANQQIVEASDYLIVISTSAPPIVAH